MNLHPEIYPRIVAAKLFIDENYQEPIDLDQVSQQAFLSRFHFHRLFTRIYKITPHQYLTQVRLDAAKRLLEKEGISITDICNQTGYESLASFSALFRREQGYTPQYYRNIAWLKKKLAREQPRRLIPHCFLEQYRFDQ